ncbi:MAG: signal peptidase I [Acidimicrobiia bacterium]|nr:MAG: signal peptidase I [Acidimicrobiia bacterium]
MAALLRGVTRRFAITENSMTPVLEPGDWVLARKRTGVPRRGDIVVFDDPSGSGLNLVKRVIGLPGEEVTTTNGHVIIDDAILAERWAVGSTGPDGTWTVPPTHVWVLGDNRGHSTSDGRSIGTTPIDAIGWRVAATYWPTSRIAIHS